MKHQDQTLKTDSEQAQAVAKRIINIRDSLGLNQSDFASSLGMSASYISKMETAKKTPGAGFFLKLMKIHNVNLDYLFSGEGKMFKLDKHVDFENVKVVDSIEKTLWLMERSPIFRHAIFAHGTLFIEQNESVIKRNIEEWKKKNKT